MGVFVCRACPLFECLLVTSFIGSHFHYTSRSVGVSVCRACPLFWVFRLWCIYTCMRASPSMVGGTEEGYSCGYLLCAIADERAVERMHRQVQPRQPWPREAYTMYVWGCTRIWKNISAGIETKFFTGLNRCEFPPGHFFQHKLLSARIIVELSLWFVLNLRLNFTFCVPLVLLSVDWPIIDALAPAVMLSSITGVLKMRPRTQLLEKRQWFLSP